MACFYTFVSLAATKRLLKKVAYWFFLQNRNFIFASNSLQKSDALQEISHFALRLKMNRKTQIANCLSNGNPLCSELSELRLRVRRQITFLVKLNCAEEFFRTLNCHRVLVLRPAKISEMAPETRSRLNVNTIKHYQTWILIQQQMFIEIIFFFIFQNINFICGAENSIVW